MSMNFHILVVEDDPPTRELLTSYFTQAGYRVSAAADGRETQEIMNREKIDLVLLDLNLPDTDGVALARDLRAKSRVGIIMVTARTDTIDRVVGLEIGADDYVTKPFEVRELLARAKNVLHRTAATRAAPGIVYRFEGWTLDLARRQLTTPTGDDVSLTTTEFDLLLVFLERPGRPMTRQQILEFMNDAERGVNERSIDTTISRLRRKLERDPRNPRLIGTSHGIGYRFAAKVE
jgi:DNA-binding response OmpR family regulator